MIAAIGGGLLLLLLAAGAPVGFALLVAGSAGLLLLGGPGLVLGVLETAPFSAPTSYELITIPMFLLMAEFVIVSGIADDLFRAAAVWVGRLPAGLAIATALAGAGFGAISGSSTASAATLSATTIPSMIKHKYDPNLACGVVAISGTLAMLIPPSVAIVLYGIIADQSIGKLLIGGVIPGIMVALTIIATVLVLYAIDPRRAPAAGRYSWREKLYSLRVAGPMIVLFTSVTGVIYLGVATPTEASAIGAFGALGIALISRRLTLARLTASLAGAAHTTCMIIMIILGAHVFGYFFTITQTTQGIVSAVANAGLSRYVVLAFLIFMYLVLGCFMDQIAILILTIPVVLPVVLSLGFDPIWFGILVIVTAEVGMVTPPVGMNCFVVARYTARPLGEIFDGVMPHVVAHILFIVILVIFPELVLWLPSQMD